MPFWNHVGQLQKVFYYRATDDYSNNYFYVGFSEVCILLLTLLKFLWKILCNFHILVRWMVITFRTKMICIYYPRNLSVSKIAKDFPWTFPFNKLIILVLQCTYFFRLNIEMQPLFKKPKIKWVKVFSSTIPDKWN